ncbi:MAG: tRNA (adenosine(37)-N6)-threonylcarbamoyltransferase complex transferase subunit TsaD [Candidatus Jidaibacter sp.]|jgi:N6-L-threonylcarbamoyladenine synthase|nr:tRNA (adenosine(37)-N6)-threonylcarbamoyltransferase complex transferase subunit TsaD [Candidatus Jidaibacter sp.]
MIVLGIESSCDETAIAIVNDSKQTLSHINTSQIKQHANYGGVVPELASRYHLDAIDSVFKQALADAKISVEEIDAIAVTAGPGLIGGLIVGLMFAKGLAFTINKPLIAVNHLEAHALTPRITSDVEFPFLLLLVSGGHCQILEVLGVGKYNLLGATRDDAVGEAFDKVAKMMGLPYPGGPNIEKLAKSGNESAHQFSINFSKFNPYDFSFSGLKTAVRRKIESMGELSHTEKADIAASFQFTVANALNNRMKNACEVFKQKYPEAKHCVIAGGVAANNYIKRGLSDVVGGFGLELIAPPLSLCTDNGVMVAWAGLERFQNGLVNDLNVEPRARWPLMEL